MYKVSGGKCEGKSLLKEQRRKLEDNNRTDLTGVLICP